MEHSPTKISSPTLEDKYKFITPHLQESKEHCVLKMTDGKEAKLPIIEGTLGPNLIDIRTLYQQAGVFTFDPGFMATGSCMSNITFIDGEKGKLLHRGYNIEELCEKSSYIELCYLLLYGILPVKEELQKFEKTVYSSFTERLTLSNR